MGASISVRTFPITSSMMYFDDAGSTSPTSRLMSINTAPKARRPRWATIRALASRQASEKRTRFFFCSSISLPFSCRDCCESHVSPHLRHVHIYYPLWRPKPVVFLCVGRLAVIPVDNLVAPFDAREIDAPLISIAGRSGLMRVFSQRLPGDRHLYRPTFIYISRIIQCSRHFDRSLQSNNIPAILGPASVQVWLGQKQIPYGVERIDLKLVVFISVAVRIDEDFEVIVVKDYRITLCQRSPNVRLIHLGANVKVLIIPQHPGARRETRAGPRGALDVNKVVRRRRPPPRRFIQLAVNPKLFSGSITNVLFRRRRYNQRRN